MLSAYASQKGFLQDALKLFQQMKGRKGSNNIIDAFAWGSLLSVCAVNGDLATAKKLQNELMSSGVETTCVPWNGLVSLFAKCGSYDDAMKVYNCVPPELKNDITLSSIVAAHSIAKGKDTMDSALKIF